jgi:hypothetical protein
MPLADALAPFRHLVEALKETGYLLGLHPASRRR